MNFAPRFENTKNFTRLWLVDPPSLAARSARGRTGDWREDSCHHEVGGRGWKPRADHVPRLILWCWGVSHGRHYTIIPHYTGVRISWVAISGEGGGAQWYPGTYIIIYNCIISSNIALYIIYVYLIYYD